VVFSSFIDFHPALRLPFGLAIVPVPLAPLSLLPFDGPSSTIAVWLCKAALSDPLAAEDEDEHILGHDSISLMRVLLSL
jgi:hypothetical protein